MLRSEKIKNILVLTYWSYSDGLIQTYTLPYVRMIRKNIPAEGKMWVLTLEQDSMKMTEEEWEKEKKLREAEGIHILRYKYTFFSGKALFRTLWYLLRLTLLIFSKHISVIHVWCTPAGAWGIILSLLTFRPLVIDSYEPHAQSMVENGNWKPGSLPFRILFKLEKWQTRRAKAFISTTEGMRDYARTNYGINPVPFYVKPSCVDLSQFDPTNIRHDLLEALGWKDKIICIYAGKIGGIYLDKEIFEFIKVADAFWNHRLRVLFLTTTPETEVQGHITREGLDPSIFVIKFVPHRDISGYMSIASFALNPVRPVPTKRYCTSIKDGEYWAMGLPVVITPDISDDSGIIQSFEIGSVLKGFTENDYLSSVKEIDTLLHSGKRDEIRQKIRSVAVNYRSYSIAEKIYQQLYGKE